MLMQNFNIVKIKKSEFYKTRKEKLMRIIDELFKLSEEISKKEELKPYLQKIGEHIWKLKTHFKIKLERKHAICRKCKTVLIPGKTLQVRNYEGYMIYKCLNCENERRFKLKSKSVNKETQEI